MEDSRRSRAGTPIDKIADDKNIYPIWSSYVSACGETTLTAVLGVLGEQKVNMSVHCIIDQPDSRHREGDQCFADSES